MLLDLGKTDGTSGFDNNQKESLLKSGSATRDNPWYPACKVIIEFVAAFWLLVLTAPLILIAALLTKLSSRGPAIYSQIRLGRHGVPYTIYKVRTMTHQCEKWSGPQWSKAGDPRVTPIGSFLRSTHVDELPQLWNVLRGEMSLVGPRPERPEFIPFLECSVPYYRQRLGVRPGVTGLAQVQLPADSDIRSVRRKLMYDLYYIQHMSPWLDVRIVVCTLLKVCGVRFPVLRKLFRMPHGRAVKLAYRTLSAGQKPRSPSSLPNNVLP
jgi:lipopolysaccharide/colanic/teichoic acid biosynthesis glycosyltransferase